MVKGGIGNDKITESPLHGSALKRNLYCHNGTHDSELGVEQISLEGKFMTKSGALHVKIYETMDLYAKTRSTITYLE